MSMSFGNCPDCGSPTAIDQSGASVGCEACGVMARVLGDEDYAASLELYLSLTTENGK